jgi:hypothetical protein
VYVNERDEFFSLIGNLGVLSLFLAPLTCLPLLSNNTLLLYVHDIKASQTLYFIAMHFLVLFHGEKIRQN